MTDIVRVALIAATPATIAALVGLWTQKKAIAIKEEVHDLKVSVNGRLTQLLEAKEELIRSGGPRRPRAKRSEPR